mmetsp:Transcript_20360/g.65107  ORF Transcript_20360/g.65107 Transcript_20360/m.65107 type:complete len:567 (+) Transcript_20360:377-2077(+)
MATMAMATAPPNTPTRTTTTITTTRSWLPVPASAAPASSALRVAPREWGWRKATPTTPSVTLSTRAPTCGYRARRWWWRPHRCPPATRRCHPTRPQLARAALATGARCPPRGSAAGASRRAQPRLCRRRLQASSSGRTGTGAARERRRLALGRSWSHGSMRRRIQQRPVVRVVEAAVEVAVAAAGAAVAVRAACCPQPSAGQACTASATPATTTTAAAAAMTTTRMATPAKAAAAGWPSRAPRRRWTGRGSPRSARAKKRTASAVAGTRLCRRIARAARGGVAVALCRRPGRRRAGAWLRRVRTTPTTTSSSSNTPADAPPTPSAGVAHADAQFSVDERVSNGLDLRSPAPRDPAPAALLQVEAEGGRRFAGLVAGVLNVAGNALSAVTGATSAKEDTRSPCCRMCPAQGMPLTDPAAEEAAEDTDQPAGGGAPPTALLEVSEGSRAGQGRFIEALSGLAGALTGVQPKSAAGEAGSEAGALPSADPATMVRGDGCCNSCPVSVFESVSARQQEAQGGPYGLRPRVDQIAELANMSPECQEMQFGASVDAAALAGDWMDYLTKAAK